MGFAHAHICTELYRIYQGFELMMGCLLMPCAIEVGICQVVSCLAALVWGLASPVNVLIQPLACGCRLSGVCSAPSLLMASSCVTDSGWGPHVHSCAAVKRSMV